MSTPTGRPRGRPKGSRDPTHKPETIVLAIRVTPEQSRLIQGLIAGAQLRNQLKLTPGEILEQAMGEYDAARNPKRNCSVNNLNPPPKCWDPTPTEFVTGSDEDIAERRRSRQALRYPEKVQ